MTWPPPRPPWWVPILAVALAVAVLVWALNGRRNARRDLAAAEELHRMELAGLNVAHQVDRDALMQDLLGEATASAALAEELARIKAALPGAKPIATAHGSTPWKPVGPAAGSASSSPPAAGVDVPPPVPAPPSVRGGTCPPCRLWVGDELQVRAGGAALETELGNIAVAAAASVWRRPAGGGPEENLHSEKLKLDVNMLEAARPPGWGVGAAVVGGREGWWMGPLAASPPVEVLSVDWSVILAAGAGPGGAWGGLLGLLARPHW